MGTPPWRRSLMRWVIVLGALVVGMFAPACASAPEEPEGFCYSDSHCPASTPVCDDGRGMCTLPCASSADCAELRAQTSCNLRTASCDVPCTTDQPAFFACVAGERAFCELDSSLSCSICPDRCSRAEYCDVDVCVARAAAGEPCTSDSGCLDGRCTSAGVCSVAHGEACTPETCAGTCAERYDGSTLCITQPGCPAGCAESTAGGLEWTCVRYETYSACVPLERCIWQDTCGTFREATCGQSCRSGGGCWTYCVPNPISTDD